MFMYIIHEQSCISAGKQTEFRACGFIFWERDQVWLSDLYPAETAPVLGGVGWCGEPVARPVSSIYLSPNFDSTWLHSIIPEWVFHEK